MAEELRSSTGAVLPRTNAARWLSTAPDFASLVPEQRVRSYLSNLIDA
jgi:hypothetical protein